MEFNMEMVVYLLGLAATCGTVITRISALEKKVEKHNNMMERLFKVEDRAKSNSHRLDDLERKVG